MLIFVSSNTGICRVRGWVWFLPVPALYIGSVCDLKAGPIRSVVRVGHFRHFMFKELLWIRMRSVACGDFLHPRPGSGGGLNTRGQQISKLVHQRGEKAEHRILPWRMSIEETQLSACWSQCFQIPISSKLAGREEQSSRSGLSILGPAQQQTSCGKEAISKTPWPTSHGRRTLSHRSNLRMVGLAP